jgi:hypothetical protein
MELGLADGLGGMVGFTDGTALGLSLGSALGLDDDVELGLPKATTGTAEQLAS